MRSSSACWRMWTECWPCTSSTCGNWPAIESLHQRIFGEYIDHLRSTKSLSLSLPVTQIVDHRMGSSIRVEYFIDYIIISIFRSHILGCGACIHAINASMDCIILFRNDYIFSSLRSLFDCLCNTCGSDNYIYQVFTAFVTIAQPWAHQFKGGYLLFYVVFFAISITFRYVHVLVFFSTRDLWF